MTHAETLLILIVNHLYLSVCLCVCLGKLQSGHELILMKLDMNVPKDVTENFFSS